MTGPSVKLRRPRHRLIRSPWELTNSCPHDATSISGRSRLVPRQNASPFCPHCLFRPAHHRCSLARATAPVSILQSAHHPVRPAPTNAYCLTYDLVKTRRNLALPFPLGYTHTHPQTEYRNKRPGVDLRGHVYLADCFVLADMITLYTNDEFTETGGHEWDRKNELDYMPQRKRRGRGGRTRLPTLAPQAFWWLLQGPLPESIGPARRHLAPVRLRKARLVRLRTVRPRLHGSVVGARAASCAPAVSARVLAARLDVFGGDGAWLAALMRARLDVPGWARTRLGLCLRARTAFVIAGGGGPMGRALLGA